MVIYQWQLHAFIYTCAYACVSSGWCPGDLMANTVCFHGLSFQLAAHRNAQHTHTHIVILLTSTHTVFRVKCSANIQKAPTTDQESVQVVHIMHDFSYSLLAMWKWISAFVWKCLLSLFLSLLPSLSLTLCLSPIIVRYCIYFDTAQ